MHAYRASSVLPAPLAGLAGLVLMVGLVGCGDPWLEDVSSAPPKKLSRTGLFADLATLEPSAELVDYAPLHALYSDGLAKQRQIYLPPGQTIDASAEGWSFPEGTVLVKTFLVGSRPVETRLLFKRPDNGDWDYALYEWDEAGTDARRRDDNWAAETVTVDGVEHSLPSRLDCRNCHETSEELWGTPVLGLSAYQVDDDFANSEAFDAPPEQIPAEGRNPEESAALGYFIGNCVSCHNGGEGLNSVFSLYPEVAVDNTVNQALETNVGEGVRIVPGDVEGSALYEIVSLAGERGYLGDFDVMPPLGVEQPDPDVAAILAAWIETLPELEP